MGLAAATGCVDGLGRLERTCQHAKCVTACAGACDVPPPGTHHLPRAVGRPPHFNSHHPYHIIPHHHNHHHVHPSCRPMQVLNLILLTGPEVSRGRGAAGTCAQLARPCQRDPHALAGAYAPLGMALGMEAPGSWQQVLLAWHALADLAHPAKPCDERRPCLSVTCAYLTHASPYTTRMDGW